MDIRMKLAIVNAILLVLAVGFKGKILDYALVSAYLAINILCLAWPALRRIVISRWFRYPVLLLDLAFTCYMIFRSGGIRSDLYLFLFLPVAAATIVCRYLGVLAWSTLMALAYSTGVWFAGDIRPVSLVIRIGYLYLAGIFMSFLIRRTYQDVDEYSNQLERTNKDLRRLNQSLKEVAASSDLEQIFAETVKITCENYQTPMVAVMIIDMQGELRIVDSFGWTDEWLKSYQSYPLSKYSLALAPILVFKRPLICPDIRKHNELMQTFAGTGIKSVFAYPLVIKDELVGVVMLTNHQIKSIPDEDSQILESITHQAGIALQNAIAIGEEKQKADTDGLTGLFNRGYFNEKIEALVTEVQHHPGFLSLILTDIDNFKKYNDTYGHPAGDRLLKRVAGVIMEAVRDEDIVARYGGEEFVVILRNSDNELTLQIAERIRQAVERLRDQNCSVTISLGVGTIPDHAQDAKTLLDYTDRSLYAAKHTGKNRVCCGWEEGE
jgi:diguanylate cyclase (GGDEF)-like protein